VHLPIWGGASGDYGESLVIGTGGDVYVTGWTESSDFPTTPGAYDTALNGLRDVFLTRLDGTVSSLRASTYLGGTDSDKGYSLALDKEGNVLVTGGTWSSDFPATPGAYDISFNGGHSDVFVSRFKSDLTGLFASTFLGGTKDDVAKYLAVDASGSVFVTGDTWSKDFPTRKDSYDTSFNGGNEDAFVSKFKGDLTGLLASTYLGGTDNDEGKSLTIDTKGNVYITGGTYSSTFPTTSGAYDTSHNGNWDVFVSKFDNGLFSNNDTDGDGLLDDWEINGYDADGDGKIDVNLPAMGANYKHKDIFVEIDWMANNNHTHKPSAVALRAVQKSFKTAPVTNPDGVDGINIHFDIGKLGGGNVVAYDDDLNPVWDEFDAIKKVHFDEKRARIFHYCLFAHNYDGSGSAGISRGIQASDFIISLGSWDNQVGTKKQQAADFMHELGHNLGLRHGGNDNVNYKPNFLSIMNYFFSMDWLRYDGKAQRLDYSRLDINDLDENALSEKKGLDQVGGDTTIKKYGTLFYDITGTLRLDDQSYKDVDWDGNATVSLSDVAVDINNDTVKSVLKGHCEEWKKIVYDGGAVGVGGGVGMKAVIKNPPPTCPEFTYEKYLWLKESTVETE